MTPAEDENKKGIFAVEYVRTNFQSSDRLDVLVRDRNRGEPIQRVTTSVRIAEPAFQEWLELKNQKESCDIYSVTARRARRRYSNRCEYCN